MASFSKGAGYTKGDLTAAGKPIILYGRLYTKYETVIENVDTFVDEKEKSVISAGNEIIVPASGETSEDISRASVVAKPGIILGGDLNIVKPNTEIDPSFLALTISNGRQQKELSKKAQGKSVVHLHNSDLKEVTLVYPKKEEQTRIGNFFKNLDNTIALHQRQLYYYKELKKATLQKMFPREGEKVPEVRFDGYTGEWELRKLGELAFFSKGTGYTKGDLTTAGKPIILYGRLYTKYETIIENVDTFVVEKEKSVISAGNEVIVPASGETSEDISRASVVAKPGIILGGDLNIIKPKTEIDPAFLALTISNGGQQKELSKKAQGKSVVHLHNSDLKEVDLVYPQKEEQSKIGTFFKHLDDTINLHQQKVKDYQKLKEVVLKQVFV